MKRVTASFGNVATGTCLSVCHNAERKLTTPFFGTLCVRKGASGGTVMSATRRWFDSRPLVWVARTSEWVSGRARGSHGPKLPPPRIPSGTWSRRTGGGLAATHRDGHSRADVTSRSYRNGLLRRQTADGSAMCLRGERVGHAVQSIERWIFPVVEAPFKIQVFQKKTGREKAGWRKMRLSDRSQ